MIDVENKKGPEILETLTRVAGATERCVWIRNK